jgi:ATP-dependent Clp protease adaptor protein ClpS
VVLHNDHFTTMDFVVDILVDVFAKDSFEADTLMRKVHESGRAPVGIYPLDIARTKVQTVHDKAKEAGFPLKCTWEKI